MTCDDKQPAPLAEPDADTRERTHAAFTRLNAVLTEVAASMLGRMHERCPYRAKDDRCTFSGGCVNQRRTTNAGERQVWCGGDHQLQRTGE